MQDSTKGLLVTLTIASLFITAILNFMVLFPQEQGVSFANGADNQTYLLVQTNANQGTVSSLNSVQSSVNDSFDKWDITQGFMGSNSIKQGTKASISLFSTEIFSKLSLLATQLFGANSDLLGVILVFSTLAGAYIVYQTILWVRTGR